MNSILQALVHTPVLRDFFLSDSHKCFSESMQCVVCELGNVFQQVRNIVVACKWFGLHTSCPLGGRGGL